MATAARPFDDLETTVIALAHRERGRGLPPATWLARAARWTIDALHPDGRLRRLADPRLEALRVFVNATYRRGGVHGQEIARIIESGFSSHQLALLMGDPPRVA